MLRKLAIVPMMLVLAACDWSACIGDCTSVEGDGPRIKGSGTLATEVRPVDKFTAIRLSDVGGELVIEQTGVESLTVTADDNLISLFTSEVKDGALQLSVAKGKSFSGKRPTYKITVRDLRELAVSGAGKIDATRLDGDALSISISGAGSGSIAGRVDDLAVAISGAGSFGAAELKAKRAKVVVSGAGQVTVNVSDELDARVSGVGAIWYIGSPKLISNVSGVGTIKKKGS